MRGGIVLHFPHRRQSLTSQRSSILAWRPSAVPASISDSTASLNILSRRSERQAFFFGRSGSPSGPNSNSTQVGSGRAGIRIPLTGEPYAQAQAAGNTFGCNYLAPSSTVGRSAGHTICAAPPAWAQTREAHGSGLPQPIQGRA